MTDNSNPAPATTPAEAQRVLVLQGGGALGSYQAGAYQALCHHDFEPEWIAGISIGAINAAIIAGNEREKRVGRLKEFWEMVSSPVPWNPVTHGDRARSLFNETSAALIATFGVPGFFTPRIPPAPLWPPGSPQSQSYYDTAPLKKTLERLVDFDRINDLKTRLSVGAVGVTSGNFKYFDNFEIQEARQENRPGAHHGLRRVAAGLSLRRNRRRAFLGWRHRLQHAARLCAGRGNQPRSPDLPGRPVQRARRIAGLAARGRRARERTSAFPAAPA